MKINYYDDTDTLLIVFNDKTIVETIEYDENTYGDLDSGGNLVALTIEHAGHKTDINEIFFRTTKTSV